MKNKNAMTVTITIKGEASGWKTEFTRRIEMFMRANHGCEISHEKDGDSVLILNYNVRDHKLVMADNSGFFPSPDKKDA